MIQLVVTDDAGLQSTPDAVVVSADNLPPTAAAGSNQLAVTNTKLEKSIGRTERELENVVFFVDLDTAHPHEADVQALLRVCAMPELLVNVRLKEASATSWIPTVQEEQPKEMGQRYSSSRPY